MVNSIWSCLDYKVLKHFKNLSYDSLLLRGMYIIFAS